MQTELILDGMTELFTVLVKKEIVVLGLFYNLENPELSGFRYGGGRFQILEPVQRPVT